jgi:glycosyltransferase involved in cell wall biosynthesis
VAENDAKDLSNKILYLYNNRNAAKTMGENGRKYAENNYDREKIMKLLEITITNITKNKLEKR